MIDGSASHLDQVDVFYIHAEDALVPLDDWLPGTNHLHEAGAAV